MYHRESAWKYSPWRMIDDLIRLNKSKKIKVLVGEHDSPEFQRQSKDLTNVRKTLINCHCLV